MRLTLSIIGLVILIVGLYVPIGGHAILSATQTGTLNLSPTTVVYDTTAPQTISYSILGGPASTSFVIQLTTSGGYVHNDTTGTTNTGGSATGTFSDYFDVLDKTFNVVGIFANGAVTNTVGIAIVSSLSSGGVLSLSPTSVPYNSLSPQTISYSITGAPASTSYTIQLTTSAGYIHNDATGTTTSSGTASGTFSDYFDVSGKTFSVMSVYSSGQTSNIVYISIGTAGATTTTQQIQTTSSIGSGGTTTTSITTSQSQSTTTQQSQSKSGTSILSLIALPVVGLGFVLGGVLFPNKKGKIW